MIVDAAERELALDPGRSFIVEAPAGSGKTGLLTQRFLRLLGVVERAESIVAMTFTRKAAAEMLDRITDALQDASQPDLSVGEHKKRTRELAAAALERGKQRGWNLLEDPGQLQIQTIDSLCAMLTRQMPVISEFGGVGKVVEDAADLYRLAARDTVRALTEGTLSQRALFHRIALHFDNEMGRLERQVAFMLKKREQWAGLPRQAGDPLVDDFAELLDLARLSLRSVFRRAATVDFTEVARAARKALGTPESPTDLLYSLDYRIEHLLVDEFQDTSRSQYELVKALTEQWSEGDNRSLFLVGDPMQSVYRFREAEIALFLRCWHEKRLGSVRLETLSLKTNFRSTPELLGWVQEMIGPAMPEDNADIGAVKFRASEAARPASKIPVRVAPFIEDKGSYDEAADIVRTIERAPAGASIAILLRARSHVTAILPALRRAEIPYRAIDIEALKDQQHVMDVLSLTRALLHLGDRVSWLACLRAPWCGLTLADLATLAEHEPDRTIFDLISDPAKVAALSNDGRVRVIRTQQALSAAVDAVGRVPLRDLVRRAWLALGGPATLHEQNRRDDVATFLALVGSLEQGGVIRDFSLMNEKLELFFARPASTECRVEIMTIHQAKGLEFDVVIVPQIGRFARSSEPELLVWTEKTADDGTPLLLIAAQPQKGALGDSAAYREISEEMKKKDHEESKRLFYVACTRARNELHLLGNAERKKDGTLKNASSGTFLGLIWPAVKPLFEAELRKRVPRQQSLLYPASEELSGTVVRRLAGDWRMPKFEMSVAWTPELQLAPASARKVSYEWVGDTSRHMGTVIHGLLQRAAGEGVEKWNVARVAALKPFIRSGLLGLGVPAVDEPKTTNLVVRALSNTLGSPRGQWVLKSHAEAQSELAIGGMIAGKLVSAKADRVFRDEEGRFWIVDFKNSDHKGSKRSEFLDEERRRYTEQLERYATLLRRVRSGAIMLGLYFPLMDEWREWSFETGAAVAH